MNSIVGSRVGSLSQGVAVVALLSGATACSSNSSNVATPDSGSTAMDGGVGDSAVLPMVDGSGMACTPLTTVTTATKISLNVTWPMTLATAAPTGGADTSFFIWLKSTYTITGNAISGTTWTCGNVTPPFTLTTTGAQSEGVNSGAPVSLLIQFQNSVWNSITRSTAATGVLGGWNVGSSFQVDPVTSLLGIEQSNALSNASTAWPQSETTLDPTTFTDDDHDNYPGITATPATDGGFYPPVTALSGPNGTGVAPAASSLFIVSRTELSLYGSSTSCTEGSGTATVKLLNNHVVGCTIAGMTAPDGGAVLCDSAGAQFLDINTTQYTVMSGTYQTIQVPNVDAAALSCDDVRAMVP